MSLFFFSRVSRQGGEPSNQHAFSLEMRNVVFLVSVLGLGVAASLAAAAAELVAAAAGRVRAALRRRSKSVTSLLLDKLEKLG